MGKYMRKSKATGEISLMEVSQSLGVRTRAKTLALQRLQKSPVPLPPATASGTSYLQLRSRRLEKLPIAVSCSDSKRQKSGSKQNCLPNPNPNSVANSRTGSVDSGGALDCLNIEEGNLEKEATEDVMKAEIQENDEIVDVVEAFGENMLEFEVRGRTTRESTPCSFIKEPDTITTPGSTTRCTSLPEDGTRVQNSIGSQIPTTHEMNEFFSGAEEEQQQQFVKKYNFDPVKDEPLPGRYKWVKVNP